MSEDTSKLKKIRTFRDDVERARQGVPSKTPTEVATPPVQASSPTQPVTPPPTPQVPEQPVTPSAPTMPAPVPKAVKPTPTITPPIPKTTTATPATEPVTSTPVKTLETLGEIKTDNVVLGGDSKANETNDRPADLTKSIDVTAGGERVNLIDTDNEIGEGSIITDRKRDRFRLFPAIWEAFTGWISSEQKERQLRTAQKEAAKPKVRSAKERADLIKKAATGSVFANQADRLKIKKTPIKKTEETKSVDEKKIVNIKQKEEVPNPTWSHYEGDKAVAPAEPTPVVEQAPTTPAPVTQPPTPPAPAPQVTEQPVTPPTPELATPIKEEIQTESVQPTPKEKTTTTNKKTSRWTTILLIVAITLLAIGAGVALSFWLANTKLFKSEPTTPTVNDPVLPDITNTPIEASSLVSLGRNRSDLYNALKQADTNDSQTITFHTIAINDSSPASVDQIMNTLSLSAPGSFIRTINNIKFGTHYSGAPVILLSTNSFEAAFGGILEWEGKMSDELEPLFTKPTSTSTPAKFVDEVIQNTAVRVLRDDLNRESIVYGFIEQNLLLITTERSIFGEIEEQGTNLVR